MMKGWTVLNLGSGVDLLRYIGRPPNTFRIHASKLAEPHDWVLCKPIALRRRPIAA